MPIRTFLDHRFISNNQFSWFVVRIESKSSSNNILYRFLHIILATSCIENALKLYNLSIISIN